jgi:serine protease
MSQGKEQRMKARIRPRRAALCAAVLIAVCSTPAFAGRVHLDGLRSDVAFDQFIVKYRDGSAERRDAAEIDRGLAQASRAVAGKGRAGPPLAKHFRRMSLGADVVRVDRKLDRVDAETLMRAIAADPDVEYVEVDVRMYPTLSPNDTRYGEQWHYFQATAGVDLPRAWDRSTGTGVVVAVLDTGSTAHSDMDANTVAGYDFIANTFISRDGDGRDANPSDPGDWTLANDCFLGWQARNSSWHGTHVAGTVAALTNNGRGVAGVAFGARVQHVRVLGRCGGDTSDIADAITWASGGAIAGVPANTTPAQVINMSLGTPNGGSCSTTYQDAINGAVNRGAIVVVAAGNSDNNAANNPPANCANTITVAAVATNGARASWSQTQKSSFGAIVDLAAPGSSVLSTMNTGTQAPGSETYATRNGTSMAAPHVAGVAALVQSRRIAAGLSLFTPAQMENHLRNTVRAFPATPDQPIGTGILNAYNAVVSAAPAPPIINSVNCSGTGGGYCSVSFDSPTPTNFSWSGGFSSGCTGPTCSGVCGNLGSFTIKITVTATNSAGSTSMDAWPFCQR